MFVLAHGVNHGVNMVIVCNFIFTIWHMHHACISCLHTLLAV